MSEFAIDILMNDCTVPCVTQSYSHLLEELKLEGNALTGEIPSSLHDLDKLGR
jgi:hypothetical protein